ncbi:MAG: hypothetical protein R3F14_36750 [Polyangiaceae bacterium]
MKNIPAYEASATEHFDAIAAAKGRVRSRRDANGEPIDRGVVLRGIRDYVLRRYREYGDKKPHLERMPSEPTAVTDEQREALLHCYDAPTTALGSLKGKIQAAQADLALCPYCGIGEPDTWDHYLSKTAFPELSVHAPNLVPCCGTCNRKKGDTLIEGGERTILHFYYDTVEQEVALLRAEVSMNAGRPTVRFAIALDTGVSAEYLRLFRHHFRRLDLLERYRRLARLEIGAIVDEVKVWARAQRAADTVRIARHLARRAEHYEESQGTNSWKAALWGAMARAHDVLQTLAQVAASGARVGT